MAPHAPTLQNPIQTPRLNLVRIQDTTPNSQHHLWFHELWADEELTAWSLRGPTHTLQESLDWMRERETKYGDINYGIFEKNAESKGTLEDPGLLIGSISLRLQASGPDLPPPPPPKQSHTSTSSEANGITNRPLNLRVIGYAIRETHWGKGYATEFGKALVAAWSAYIADEKVKGEELFYMEGVADKDNPASQRVLEKLGFERVGWKDEDEPVFLAGKWRDPGYWVYGLWL